MKFGHRGGSALNRVECRTKSLCYPVSAMTKVQVTYQLDGPVDEAVMERISQVHGVYGLQAVQLSPSMDSLLVQYDASRMKLEDVDQTLHSAGLPVRRVTA
jgi:allophanate hydrolase subunit 1